MKRVQAGCIAQTLLFSQKSELGLSKAAALETNRQEVARYKNTLDSSRTRYVIVDETERDDGSILIHIKKQINATTNTDEYF